MADGEADVSMNPREVGRREGHVGGGNCEDSLGNRQAPANPTTQYVA